VPLQRDPIFRRYRALVVLDYVEMRGSAFPLHLLRPALIPRSLLVLGSFLFKFRTKRGELLSYCARTCSKFGQIWSDADHRLAASRGIVIESLLVAARPAKRRECENDVSIVSRATWTRARLRETRPDEILKRSLPPRGVGETDHRTYLVGKFLTRRTSVSLGIVIISISQLVASVDFPFFLSSFLPFCLGQRARGVHQGVLPRVVQFVCRFDIVTSSSLII